MSKRALDYDLSLSSRKKIRRGESEPLEENEPEEIDPHAVMNDLMAMTDSVTVRENNIYFYCGVNKKNIVKLLVNDTIFCIPSKASACMSLLLILLSMKRKSFSAWS